MQTAILLQECFFMDQFNHSEWILPLLLYSRYFWHGLAEQIFLSGLRHMAPIS